jgi:hypothetical protein
VTRSVDMSSWTVSSALAVTVAALSATPEEEEVEEEEEEEEEEEGGGIEKAVEEEELQIMLKSKSTVIDKDTFLACTSISARLMGNIPLASISYYVKQ